MQNGEIHQWCQYYCQCISHLRPAYVAAQFVDGDGNPLSEVFGVRSRRLRPAAPLHSYLPTLDDFEVRARVLLDMV